MKIFKTPLRLALYIIGGISFGAAVAVVMTLIQGL